VSGSKEITIEWFEVDDGGVIHRILCPICGGTPAGPWNILCKTHIKSENIKWTAHRLLTSPLGGEPKRNASYYEGLFNKEKKE
jgi:hypothetical protein